MSKGIVLFAHNNDAIDYVAQAVFCCKKIKDAFEYAKKSPKPKRTGLWGPGPRNSKKWTQKRIIKTIRRFFFLICRWVK